MNRLIAQVLVLTFVLTGLVSTPPVMALTMQPSIQMSTGMQSGADAADCALCQHHSQGQPYHPAQPMPDCPMVACGGAVAIAAPTITVDVSVYTAKPSFPSSIRSGRLLQGPEPYPPRVSYSG